MSYGWFPREAGPTKKVSALRRLVLPCVDALC